MTLRDGRRYALFVLDRANPRWTEDGQPTCSRDECPSFDGSRCAFRGMGIRPALHCEPAVIEMATRVRSERRLATEAAATFIEAALDPPNNLSRSLVAGVRTLAGEP